MRHKVVMVLAALASVWAAAVPAADFSGDARLIGVWANEHSYVSGEFSVASETRAVLRGDGSYSFGESRMVGGGASGSFDSGTGGEAARGWWTTQDGVLYVIPAGAQQWEAYGRYGFALDGDTVRIVFGDGSQHYWSRR